MQLEDRVKGMAGIAANMQKQITSLDMRTQIHQDRMAHLESRFEELEGNVAVILQALADIARLGKEE